MLLKGILKKRISMLCLGSLLAGLIIPPMPMQATPTRASMLPDLFVTEIQPDNEATDDYEFFELYNASEKSILLNDYVLSYYYTDGSLPDKELSVPENTILESGKTLVLWYNKQGKTISEFNQKIGVSLDSQQVVEVSGFEGFANGGNRGIRIDNVQGETIALASYTKDDIGAGLSAHYFPPTGNHSQPLYLQKGAPTPGATFPEQLVSQEKEQGPNIVHTPVTQADGKTNIQVEADFTMNSIYSNVPDSEAGATVVEDTYEVSDEEEMVADSPSELASETADPPVELTGKIYYRSATEQEFHVQEMTSEDGNHFTGTIPKEAIIEEQLIYYIEAAAGQSLSRTEEFTIQVHLGDVDYNSVPSLLITELVPDSANVNGADGYEFIEVYNNTDQDMNLKDYKLYYRYTDSGPEADVLWPTDKEDMLIPAGGTFVFWVINADNGHLTNEDFNSHYGVSLAEGENLFRVYSGGMANGGKRGLAIGTNTHVDISAAYYANDEETVADKGIFYRYPVNGNTEMVKYSAGKEPATPGKVNPIQVPSQPVKVEMDNESPKLDHQEAPKSADQRNNIELSFDVSDNKAVTSVALYYKTDKKEQFTKRYLYLSYADNRYHYKVYSPELIGSKQLEYYLVLSDGVNELRTDSYSVDITGAEQVDGLHLNVKDEDILSGGTVIKGTDTLNNPGLKLRIDGNEIGAENTFPALEKDAYFAFEVTSVNYYFKNGVTSGEEILYTFQDPIDTYETLTVPIDAARLSEGQNTLSIRAGSKSSPFDDRKEENKDDFQVRNVRLVLADGTELYDPRYQNPDEEIKMGDSAGRHEYVDFQFTLTRDELISTAYSWDTTQVVDGPHHIEAESGAEQVSATVVVDNTAPVISPSLEDGKEYRGTMIINAEISDALAGVKKSSAKLDGEVIQLPYETSSSSLSGGAHELVIDAEDFAGNHSEKKVGFTVPDENPAKPELISPKNGQDKLGQEAHLQVKVSDPEGDAMDVSFYQGYLHDAHSLDSFTGYRNAADVEPPKEEVPAGETAMNEADYKQIESIDGNYLVDDSMEQFPYHRFEVKLDRTVQDSDQVKLEWVGKSLEGRKVSLYAYHPIEAKWKLLDQQIAGKEDFSLEATVLAGQYRNGQTIQMMVQDELPVSEDPYDFSFVWMSDTQYYSESYPDTYRSIVNWIKDQKDEKKIEYVIHTGDIVDESDQEYQWLEADNNMKVLEDANIPYGVLAGNHDVSHQLGTYDEYWKYFGAERFMDLPHYGESYKNNMGHYDLISSYGNDFIIVYMGWGLGQSEIDWMNEVLAKYPERKAILAFHEYLLVSGNRAPIADQIYEEVVVPNKNVIATLSGHYHDAELKVDDIDDDGDGTADRTVYQMLADYQGAEEGGLGYIRLMQFDMKNNKLHMKTYSPKLDDYNYYDPTEYPQKDEFSLDLDLQGKMKRVATDYVGVKVYTDTLIGSQDEVQSGEIAEVTWSGLEEDTKYQWYAIAQDQYSGYVVSDIWKFNTGVASEQPGPGETPDPTPGGETSPGNQGGSSGGDVNAGGLSETKVIGNVIQAQPTTAGTYVIGTDALNQALAGQGESYITIEAQQDSVSHSDMSLRLSAEALRLLHEQKVALRVKVGAFTTDLPSEVFQGEAVAGEWLEYRFTTDLPETDLALVASAVQTNTALTSTGEQARLEWLKWPSSNSKDAQSLGRLAAPVKISWKLSEAKLNADYAGVYQVSKSGSADYVLPQKSNGIEQTMTFELQQSGLYALLEYHTSFRDMINHWAKNAVEKLAAKHVVQGTGAGQFEPRKLVTRADFAVMAIRSLGLQVNKADTNTLFSDVPASAYYADEVAMAKELGYMQGNDGKFRPTDAITREEAVVVLVRLLEISDKEAKSTQLHFSDLLEASLWAREAMNIAVSEALINGRPDGSFAPKSEITRAEAAQLFYNLLQK